MSVQSWQTTSSGMAVAVYQPASADCPGDGDPTPCSEKDFGDEELQAIMESLDEQGILQDLMDDSNATSNQSDRREQGVLDQIRLNFNDYAEGADFQFYPGTVDEDIKWMTDPLGTVFTINLAPDQWIPANGSVVATDYSQTSWTFSTVYTSNDGYHPVSGNRRFGFHQDGQEIKFFSRGVDRTSIALYSIANTGGYGFNQADSVWESFQDNVRNFLGDSAEIKAPVTWRPRYSDIQDVLNGDMDISELDQCSGI